MLPGRNQPGAERVCPAGGGGDGGGAGGLVRSAGNVAAGAAWAWSGSEAECLGNIRVWRRLPW